MHYLKYIMYSLLATFIGASNLFADRTPEQKQFHKTIKQELRQITDDASTGFFKACAASGLNLYKINEQTAPKLYAMVDVVAKRLSMRTPPVFIIKTESAMAYNAFATGPIHSISMIAIGQGLLNTLTDTELEGIIAHELAHVKNYHILKNVCAVGVTSTVANFVLSKLTRTSRPNKLANALLAILSLRAIIRYHEKDADLTAAAVIENPRSIGTALETMHTEIEKNRDPLTKWFDKKFGWFHIPMPKIVKRLFSTHPLTEDRVKYLDEYATQHGK